MASITLSIPDADAMRALGEQLAAVLRPAGWLLMSGPLGAGKTTLAQGVARGLGVRDKVVSPTFVIVREYSAGDGSRFVHVDFYRIGGSADALDLGLSDELWASRAVVAVEWPENAREALPADAVDVEIGISGNGRSVSLRSAGPVSEACLRQLAASRGLAVS